MMEYLLKIKSIVDNLVAIGENITKQDRILYLLAGLRAEYNSFVISVTSGHESLSLEEIHSMLLTHENRLEQQTTEETNLMQVNIATMNLQGHNKKSQKSGQFKTQGRGSQNPEQFNHQNFGRSRGRGHYNNNGGNFGHGPGKGSFNNHFYSFGNFNNVSGGSNGKPQCQVCGKYGHIAINCYHRFDQTYQSTMNNQLAVMVCNSVHCWRWKLVHGYRSYASPNSKSQQFEFTYSICWFRLSRRWKWYLFKYLKYRTLHYFFSFSVIKSKEYFTCSTTYNQSDKCE